MATWVVKNVLDLNSCESVACCELLPVNGLHDLAKLTLGVENKMPKGQEFLF